MTDLTVNIRKEYNCSSEILFGAVAEGILFKYTGAHMDKLKMDFKVGGNIFVDWGTTSMHGVFKEIMPFEKIVLTWNHLSEALGREEATLVTITIKEQDGKSFLNLLHEGFAVEKDRADHEWGWTDATDDMHKSHFKF